MKKSISRHTLKCLLQRPPSRTRCSSDLADVTINYCLRACLSDRNRNCFDPAKPPYSRDVVDLGRYRRAEIKSEIAPGPMTIIGHDNNAVTIIFDQNSFAPYAYRAAANHSASAAAIVRYPLRHRGRELNMFTPACPESVYQHASHPEMNRREIFTEQAHITIALAAAKTNSIFRIEQHLRPVCMKGERPGDDIGRRLRMAGGFGTGGPMSRPTYDKCPQAMIRYVGFAGTLTSSISQCHKSQILCSYFTCRPIIVMVHRVPMFCISRKWQIEASEG